MDTDPVLLDPHGLECRAQGLLRHVAGHVAFGSRGHLSASPESREE
jgi:hypothetical protein